MRIRRLTTLLVSLAIVGCAGARYHRDAVSGGLDSELTVGQVQKEICIGMSGADVASALGSPNIVTTDTERRESWIYDKISTERAYSSDAGGILTLIFGSAKVEENGGGGSIFPSYTASSGAAASTQKTLTVIIKFDHDKRVRDFAYHSSKF